MSGLDYLKGQGKQLLTTIDFPLDTLLASHSALWFLMIEVGDVHDIRERIIYFVGKDRSLAMAKDFKK